MLSVLESVVSVGQAEMRMRLHGLANCVLGLIAELLYEWRAEQRLRILGRWDQAWRPGRVCGRVFQNLVSS
jgi:hypothetical protein